MPCIQRNFADLVEKQRAAIGEFESPDAIAHRAGEGAADVAEEFAFEQFARDRRAIDPDQRPVAAAARLVDGARDQFLAGAGFAGDHHGCRRRRHQLDLAQRLLDRLALPDDAARIGLDADFLLQVGVFQLQPLAQAVDLGERRMQFFVGLAALADVAEHDDSTNDDAAVADRRRGVFDPDRRAVLAPEHLALDLVHGAVAKRRVDRAVMIGIVPPIMMGVVNDRVDFLADQFFRRPAQHALGGRIDEGGLAFGVDAVNAFAGGAQDQLVFAFNILEHPFDALPGRDPAAHMVFGRRIDIATAARIEVAHGEQHQRATVTRHKRAGIFEPERLPRGVTRRERIGPECALVEDRLREHDQRRELARVQRADLGLPQQRAVVAEQGAGRRIGVEDQVGMGIEQQRWLDGMLERGGVEIDILRPSRRSESQIHRQNSEIS